jgi:glyoxylase-like metal-dependent hydrolase (beta-lactamase superfamily II)
LRALALHPDVLVVTSALMQVNCVIVRGGVVADAGENPVQVTLTAVPNRPEDAPHSHGDRAEQGSETFVIDSPVLPDELDALPALIEQARFPAPSGLLATHGDWDHLLGRLAFPGAALGVAKSTAKRLDAAPGEVQRELRAFDEELLIERARPLALGSLQALPVPGRCEVGDRELELHPTSGHTSDGMAVVLGWAGVLVVGDYLSTVELPSMSDDDLEGYLATLQQLRALIVRAQHVVPGHGPVLDREGAIAALEEDREYLLALRERGEDAEIPPGRKTALARRAHARNAKAASFSRPATD